jgi:predicted transcriptional regulator
MEKVNKKTNFLTLQEKLDIIETVEHGSGKSMCKIAMENGLSRSALTYIMKEKEKIKEACKNPVSK